MSKKVYIVDGKSISEDEFKKLQENINIKLVLQEDGTYKILEKLLG